MPLAILNGESWPGLRDCNTSCFDLFFLGVVVAVVEAAASLFFPFPRCLAVLVGDVVTVATGSLLVLVAGVVTGVARTAAAAGGVTVGFCFTYNCKKQVRHIVVKFDCTHKHHITYRRRATIILSDGADGAVSVALHRCH